MKDVGLHSDAATQLLLATAAQESGFGTYIKQLGKGPALGVFEVEKATHDDLWKNNLRYKKPLAEKILDYVPARFDGLPNGVMKEFAPIPDASVMVWNLAYAILMARVHYLRVKEAIPGEGDIEGMWKYYKKYFNTPQGAATKEEFMQNYQKYVA